PPVVRRLLGPARCAGYLLARETLGRLGPHLVEADDGRPSGLGRVEFFDRPLFAANSGSTFSPNQVSCLRHRRPSAIRISSIRVRLMPIPLCSLRYAARRSSVHDANGSPSASGLVRAAAMTSAR